MEWLLIYGTYLLMLFLLAISAFFSASETALFSLPRREAGGGAVKTLLSDQRALLVTVLVGNMFVNVLYSSLAALAAAGVGSRHGAAGLFAVMAAALLALIVFGEVVPKNIAMAAPGSISRVSAPVLLLFSRLLGPVRRFFDVLVRVLTRVMLGPGEAATERLTADELDKLVEIGAETGLIGGAQHQFIQEVIDLAELKVREIMVPRTELATSDVTDGRRGILAVAAAHRVSKVPVYEINTDSILGVCHVKDLLIRPGAALREVLWRPQYVPGSMKVDALMTRFLRADDSVFLVVDEHGALSGLVTIEDASEEVVGEILDEYDRERREVQHVGEGRYLVAGSLPRREFAERFGCELPAEKADTVAGFVLARLGHIPVEGESVEEGPFRLTVARVFARRIRSLHVERTGRSDKDNADA